MQSCSGKLHHSITQVILYSYLHIASWGSYSGKQNKNPSLSNQHMGI